jgi:hypothetical protein
MISGSVTGNRPAMGLAAWQWENGQWAMARHVSDVRGDLDG